MSFIINYFAYTFKSCILITFYRAYVFNFWINKKFFCPRMILMNNLYHLF